jgi:2-oxoisovalerate dehydrogenase E1 component beta subunit
MSEQTFLEAIRAGLHEEMSRDSAVYVFGEDVSLGGPFGVTKGLAEDFGTQRVVNTPISEGTVMGLAIGAATAGLRPVIEIMFIDFITLALDQLVNHAAKLYYMSGGQLAIPLTVRVQCGISGAMGAHHSQSLESWLAHVPGLQVVMPSNPADAKGLLKAAIRDDDCVLFFEHKYLYRRIKEELPSGDYVVPIGKARVAREGRDLSIITYAATVWKALEAAEQLAREDDLSVEVIDLRSLLPMDDEAIAATVKKTNRVLIVHEDTVTGGVAGEIAARINDLAFEWLDAPIKRVAAHDVPLPYAPQLEDFVLPQTGDIVRAARWLAKY